MFMDNNDIKENEIDNSDNISIHSIVTDQEEFDSDNEAPSDQTNQVDKIILNHVVKKIQIPGYGVEKPSKYDFITIKYQCYFLDKSDEKIIELNEVKNYLNKIKLPYGIVKAITFMRKKEKSIVTLETKYGFRKVEFEKIDRYLEIDKLKFKHNDNLKILYEKLKKNTLIYEIELIDMIKIYDLTGKRNLLKRILKLTDKKKDTSTPNNDCDIKINYNIYKNNIKILELNDINTKLNEKQLTEIDIYIIKSMKKREKCIVEIERNYFKEIMNKYIKNENIILIKELNKLNINIENLFDSRIQIEIELINFNNKISEFYYKNKTYIKTILCKGIGNLNPWNDSLIMLASHLEINNNLIYSNFPNKNIETMKNNIKSLKNKIKLIPFYEQDIQFILGKQLKENNLIFPIYEPLLYNFPNIFRKEILKSMKPLNIINISFSIGKEDIEDNYFNFENEEIKYDFSKSNILNISYTCCLLNFEDNLFVLNNKLIKNKTEKLLLYKDISNNFYKKGFLNKSKKINKKIVDNYIKYINLENAKNIAYNDQINKFTIDVTKSINYSKDIDDIIRKIFSNLILILYKLDKKKECEKYIKEFLKLYLKDEKVQYYNYLINKDYGNYENAKVELNNLIELNQNFELYKNELKFINEKIQKNKEQHEILLKKMMFQLNNNDDKAF